MIIIVDLFNQHSGNLKELERAIHSAVINGADAIKLQLFKSRTVWGDESRAHLELSHSDFERIVTLCQTLKIDLLASVFDEERLQWIIDADIKIMKIASRSVIENRVLCDKILSLNRPTFVSCGAFGSKQLEKEFKRFAPFGINDLITYLYCSSNYPTLLDEDLAKGVSVADFEFFGGYSDHTPGIAASIIALVRGARIIEKHFSFSTSLQSTTERGHFCSFTPQTLSQFRILSREISTVLS